MKRKLMNAKKKIYSRLRCSPSAYSLMSFFKPRLRRFIVTRNTEIMIEGYPRSANSSTVIAFRYAQKREVSIAHHAHAPAQLLLASKFGIPSLVIIRNPLHAVSSLLLMDRGHDACFQLK